MEEQSGSTQPKLSKTPTGSTADLTGGKSGSGKTIGNYEVVKNIGEGSFAKVRLAVHRLTGQKVAIKCIDKANLPDEYSLRNMHREAYIMKLLDHPNIIRLYEVMETKKDIFLVLEYAGGGEVLDYIVAHGRLKEPEAKKLAAQIVDALSYCHQNNVVHRDFKTENLLLDEELNVKISDFGLSNVFDASSKLKTFCGSPIFSAPELLNGIQYTGPEVDVWSFGVNLYSMVVGELPFNATTMEELLQMTARCEYKDHDFTSEEFRDLIRHILVRDPKKRFTIDQIKQHPWFESYQHIFKDRQKTLRPTNAESMDNEVIAKMEQFGFDKKAIVDSVLKNTQDDTVATYFLFQQLKLKDIEKFNAVGLNVQKNPAPLQGSRPATPDVMQSPPPPLKIDTAPHTAPINATSTLPTVSAPKSPTDKEKPTITPRIIPPSSPKPPISRPSSADMSSLTVVIPASPLPPKPRSRPPSLIFDGKENSEPTNIHAAVRRRARATTVTGQSAECTASLENLPQSPTIEQKLGSTDSVHRTTKPRPRSIIDLFKDGNEKEPSSTSPLHLNHRPSPLRMRTDTSEDPKKSPHSSKTNILQRIASGLTGEKKPSRQRSQTVTGSSSRTNIDSRVQELQAEPSNYSKSSGSNMVLTDSGKPIRTARFAFTMSMTSAENPDSILSEIQSALTANKVNYTIHSYLLMCEHQPADESRLIKFEVEICKIPRLSVYGIRLKRMGGDVWEYKRLATQLIKSIENLKHEK